MMVKIFTSKAFDWLVTKVWPFFNLEKQTNKIYVKWKILMHVYQKTKNTVWFNIVKLHYFVLYSLKTFTRLKNQKPKW